MTTKPPSAPPRPDLPGEDDESIEPAPPDKKQEEAVRIGDDQPPSKPPKRPKNWIKDLLVISTNAYQREIDKDPFEP